jgi:hypothetical protein
VEPQDLIFSQTPEVEYGSNFFLNVPVILQYDDSPLIEVVQVQAAGFSTQFRIFNGDGVYIAKVVGSQVHPTKDGEKSNITRRHEPGLTAVELNGKTLFEIRRKEAAALKTEAELFTPEGRFIKSNSAGAPSDLISAGKEPLRLRGVTITRNRFVGVQIGVRIGSDGSIAVGIG